MIEPSSELLQMKSFNSQRKMVLMDPAITEESEQMSSSEEAEFFDIFNDL